MCSIQYLQFQSYSHTKKRKKKKEKSCLILQYLLLFVDTPLGWIERRIIALICVSDEVLVLTIPTVFIQKEACPKQIQNRQYAHNRSIRLEKQEIYCNYPFPY